MYGLLGQSLKHSFSKRIHERFGYDYDLIEVQPDDLSNFFASKKYDGFNVTIPYKQAVLPFLDNVDDLALRIGAVNTVKLIDDKYFGFNTDYAGLLATFNRIGVSLSGKNVLILGSGGASKVAQTLCDDQGAKAQTVSRSGAINYENCKDCAPNIVINATPVGTYPNVENCPIDLSIFNQNTLEAVVDLIYNPHKTVLLLQAEQLGLKTSNGLTMLVKQAAESCNVFTNKRILDEELLEVENQIEFETSNIVLEGMPASGKSTIGKLLAKKLGRKFVDIDEEIERCQKMPISQIFAEKGENFFREIERRQVAEFTKESGLVIALGGGAVLNEANRRAIKQNSIVVHIKRNLQKLSFDNRPLSKDLETLKTMELQRMPFYDELAQIVVENVKIAKTLEEIIAKLSQIASV